MQKISSQPLFRTLKLPLDESRSVLRVAYVPAGQVFLVSIARSGETWLISWKGEVLGKYWDEILDARTLNEETLVRFRNNDSLDWLKVGKGEILLKPSLNRPHIKFCLLPDHYIASFNFDLGPQYRRIGQKIDALNTSIDEGKDVDKDLVIRLWSEAGVDTEAELEEWKGVLEIFRNYPGETLSVIDVPELSEMVRREEVPLVYIYDDQGEEVARLLNPPDLKGATFARFRSDGCWGGKKLYYVNTIEPTLYALGFDPSRQSDHALWLEKKIDLMQYLGQIPAEQFVYRAASRDINWHHPVDYWGYTPTWKVLAFDDEVLVRVADFVNKKSALLLFNNDQYIGSVITSAYPQSATEDMLVMEKNNTLYLFSSISDLLTADLND